MVDNRILDFDLSDMNSKEKFIHLRKIFKSFNYEKFTTQIEDDKLDIYFYYSLKTYDCEKISFKHKLSYSFKNIDKIGNKKKFENLETKVADYRTLIFNIGIIEGINYYKLACPKTFNILCGHIDHDSIGWWKKLYYNGLGEFIYLNKIHELAIGEESLFDIECIYRNELEDMNQVKISESINILDEGSSASLIPVGGGKDSILTLELLSKNKLDNVPFLMNHDQAALACIKMAGYNQYLYLERILDKKIIDLNQAGYLNGHIPFSAILAFESLLGAILVKKKYIVLSNEKSANEPSVIGTNFNHQYSKTLEFERDFIEYIEKNITKNYHYFSLLRPLYEYEIAGFFARYDRYHLVFRSCNRGKKENRWCCNCPKCLFVYIILAPYIEKEKLIEIFGQDLLDRKDLENIFNEITGLGLSKPFECVGTIWEVEYSLDKLIKQYESRKEGLSYLLKLYKDRNKNKSNKNGARNSLTYRLIENGESLSKDYLKSKYKEDHYLPEEFIEILIEKIADLLILRIKD